MRRTFALVLVLMIAFPGSALAVEYGVAAKWAVYCFDATDNSDSTEANTTITASVWEDGVENAVDDTNPTAMARGIYVFDLTAAETDAAYLVMDPTCSTADIECIGMPTATWTVPPNFKDLGIESDGHAHADVKEVGGTTQTANDNSADIQELFDASDEWTTATDVNVASMDADAIGVGDIATGAVDADAMDVDGSELTAIDLPNQTMNIIGTLTGNVIGDVTGNVDGTVAGKTPSEAGDAMAITEAARTSITGGVYNLDTDANGRIRIVDGTGTGEIDTASGRVSLSAASEEQLDALYDASDEWTSASSDPLLNAVPGAYGAGTAGFVLGTNLDAKVSSRGTSDLVVGDNIGVNFSDISGTLDAGEIGGDAITADKIADGALSEEHIDNDFGDDIVARLMAHVYEGTETVAQWLRGVRAVLWGNMDRVSGVGAYRDLADAKDRITFSTSSTARDAIPEDLD